ncbi:LysR family transcriptional regulator [Pseudomonas putida]|uniref:LysR family transcriptional regulator n=1 Tax=Pseudomonas putida TaxID=303 RepID=UPI0018A99F59|nr:LysR family transcriptional regulator [Pseudomonas putida]MBF8668280.1 LysR family transcriptional regulator [Pseudomonas putida]MBF8711780.1 LysR family transcriptional regulator [Pseudomonas putida]
MDYRYFIAVADSGSLAEASKILHVATSAISRQISLLEEAVGAQLFERRPRGMFLTSAGEVLARHAKRIRLEEEFVLSSIRSNDYPTAHTLRIVSTEGISRFFLPRIMAKYSMPAGQTKFVLNVTSPSNCITLIANGDADIGLTFSTAPSKSVKIEFTHRSPICALVRRGHPLAEFKELALAQLQPYPLAITQQGTTQRQLFDLVCQMERLNFNEILLCNYSGAIQEFIKCSDAVSLGSAISHSTSSIDHNELISIKLTDQQLAQRDIQIITMPNRILPDLVKSFISTMIEELREPPPYNLTN